MAKSELHCELAERALVWLDGRATQRGIRGCVEVILKEGYVADSVAMCGLQYSQQKLFVGTKRVGNETDDYVFVFESKVSRGDFFNTFKHNNHIGNRLDPVGNFHFVVTPKGMVKPEEVPGFWGLLERSGQGLKVSKMPEFIPTTKEQLYETAYLILRSVHESKYNIFFERTDKYRSEQMEIEELELKQ